VKIYRVWATHSERCAWLWAESEANARDHIALMRLFGDLSLTAEQASDNLELPVGYAVHAGRTIKLPGR
jgi:hypothetical protein